MMIRIANEQDLSIMTDIYNEAVRTTTATFDTETKTIEERRGWFKSHDNKHPIWVCEIDQEVIGWASLSLWSDRCAYSGTVENSVYIYEKFRGKGAGKALMETLMSHARKAGFRTVIARISDGNDASVALHRQFGFENIGTMRSVGYKFNRWIDVLMMQAMLN